MLTNKDGEAVPKQVEFNLMASSFGGLMPRVRSYHQELVRAFGATHAELQSMPECASDSNFAAAMLQARDLYNRSVKGDGDIVFLVSGSEANIFDQRHLERAIYHTLTDKVMSVRVRRVSFEDGLLARIRIDADRRLFIDDLEVAVLYFRHCYSPDHFPSDASWQLRKMLELNRAIKCPCIEYMLANTKLVQTGYSSPNWLASKVYRTEMKNCALIEKSLASQWTLSPEFGINSQQEIDEIVSKAMANPSNFVLKPQREGGANNYFDAELVAKLKEMANTPQAKAFVLMERLKPPTTRNCLLPIAKGATPTSVEVTSELGFYGAFLSICEGDKEQILINQHSGHLVRTKPVHVNEAGINAGFAALDSPFLID
ncbi:hypothetical protein Ciccas_012720 [Cichlidogyrus casuarinus]|uniref:Glutathione synthetase n=1 Tax=Cichlidogyrus casuarinus TaxID=1844966 RepID=A0ABD2PPX7_9PLAT